MSDFNGAHDAWFAKDGNEPDNYEDAYDKYVEGIERHNREQEELKRRGITRAQLIAERNQAIIDAEDNDEY